MIWRGDGVGGYWLHLLFDYHQLVYSPGIGRALPVNFIV